MYLIIHVLLLQFVQYKTLYPYTFKPNRWKERRKRTNMHQTGFIITEKTEIAEAELRKQNTK